MGTEKRARQKANRQSRLAEVEAEVVKETREASTKKYGKIIGVVVGLIALVVLWNLLTGGDDDDDSGIVQIAPTPAAQVEPTPTPEVVLTNAIPADFEPWAGDRGLTLVEPNARNGAYSSAPPMTVDPARTYAAVLDTEAGPIRLELFAAEAPLAVNNFIALANDGFFDGLTFHQVEAGFLMTAGDPLGTGDGGAGYTFADEFAPELAFEGRGHLAMANDGSADSNSSQFVITLSDSAEVLALTGQHTIFGAVADTTNAAALDAIEESGAGAVIESVRVTES